MASNLNLNVTIGADVNKLNKGISDAVNIVKGGSSQIEKIAKGSQKALEEALGGGNLRVKSKQLNDLIKRGEGDMKAFKSEIDRLNKKLAASSKWDIETRKQLNAEGKKLVKQYNEERNAVRNLTIARDELNYKIQESSRNAEANTQATEALSRSINAAASAVLLFSDGNDELSSVMKVIRIAMGAASAAVALYNLSQRDNAIFTAVAEKAQMAYAAVVGTSTGALKAFRIALAASGIGLAVAVVASLASSFSELTSETDGLTDAQKRYRDTAIDLATAGQEEAASIQSLVEIIKDQNVSTRTKLQAYEELKKSVPLLEGYTLDEALANDKLTEATDRAIAAIIARSKAEVFAQASAEELKKSLEAQSMTTEEALSWWEKLVARSKTAFRPIAPAAGEAMAAFAKKTELANEAIAKSNEYQAQAKALLREAITLESFLGETKKTVRAKDLKDYEKYLDELLKLEIAMQENLNKLYVDQELKRLTTVSARRKPREMTEADLAPASAATAPTGGLLMQMAQENQDAASLDLEALAEWRKNNEALFLAMEIRARKMEQFKDRMKVAAEQASAALEQMSGEMLSAFGEMVGDALSGKADAMQTFLQSFASSLAGFLGTFGQALIAQGIAIDAFKESLENLDPVVAIVAGVGLVAASKLVKNAMAQGGSVKAFADGGIVSGPTLGLMGEYPGASSNPEVIAPLDKLQSMLNVSGGGNFVATTKFDGRDLWLAVNRYEKDKARG
jgi:uncharacterized protein YggU (UPF0235/DUF167 family)